MGSEEIVGFWIVELVTGEYEDETVWVLGRFRKEADARELRDEVDAELRARGFDKPRSVLDDDDDDDCDDDWTVHGYSVNPYTRTYTRTYHSSITVK